MIRRTTFRPKLETLERRTLLAAGLSDGVLLVAGSAGADTIVVSQSGTNALVTFNSVNSLFPLAEIERVQINGAAGADTITYTLDKRVRITGGDGNDTITTSGIAGGGIASMAGGRGDDTMTCNDAGRIFLAGNDGNDTLSANNVGIASINGGLGNDSIACTASDAVLIRGDDGDDTITSTTTGLATLEGGSGDDTILSEGSGGTIVRGGADNDGITGGFGYNNLDGGSGEDTLAGRGTASRLRGGGDRDTFTQAGGPAKLFVDQLDSYTLRSIDTADFEPVLGLGGTVGYGRDTAAITLAPFARVSDADNANFAGGGLRVRAFEQDSSNRLAIGAGFTVDGNDNVLLGTTIIGQRTSSGFGVNALQIRFNSNATTAIVQQLVRAITFKTVDGAAGLRQIIFTVGDGVGGLSANATKSVNVT